MPINHRPKIINVIPQDPGTMHITWTVNNICQNSCSYCPPHSHTGTNHGYDWNNGRDFVKLLLDRFPKMHITISGGEPSMSPFFPEMVELFYNAGHTISLTTNGARSPDYWRDIAKYINWIGFSYHSEFPTIKFVENLHAAAELTRVGARIMMLPSHWDQCVDTYTQLSSETNFVTIPVKLWNLGGRISVQYSAEQIEWLETNKPLFKELAHVGHIKQPLIGAKYLFDNAHMSHEQASHHINLGDAKFIGFDCDIGLTSLQVDANGMIYRANCHLGDSLGHIDSPNQIEWPTTSIICSREMCTCTSDVNIGKRALPGVLHDARLRTIEQLQLKKINLV